MLLEHLELAKAHVAEGEELIARQTELLEKLIGRGIPTVEAEAVLRMLIDLQAMSVADYMRLEHELAAADPK